MTLIVAMSCTNRRTKNKMVVVASDKQASSDYIQSEVTKIKPLPEKYSDQDPLIIFAASGDSYLADEICDAFDKLVSLKYDEIDDVSEYINSNRIEFSDLVGNIYSKYKIRGYESAINVLLCGCNDDSGPVILNIMNEGLNMIYYDYKIIGMGSITGGELLFRELFNIQLNDIDSSMLMMLIIDLVSKIDRSVGGGVDLHSCMNNRVLDVHPERFEESMSMVDDRWNLIRKIWWNMNDPHVIKTLVDLAETIDANEEKME